MPLVYGNRAKGRLGVMPAAFADTGYTKPGEVYEIHLDTTSFVGKEESVIDQLLTLESQVPDLKIVYAETCSCYAKVKFQVMDKGPGQLNIGGILSLLPAIFVLIGVGIIAYMLWKLYNDNPIWLLIGGVAAAFVFFYWVGGDRFFKPTGTGIQIGGRKPKEKATATERLQVEADAINKQINTQAAIVKRLENDRDKAEAAKNQTRMNEIQADIDRRERKIEQLELEYKLVAAKYGG